MQYLKNGLVLLLPLVLTVLLLGWMVPMLDMTFRPILGLFWDSSSLSSGFVIGFGLILLLILAVLIQAPLINLLYRLTEKLIGRLPIIGPVYRSFVEAIQLMSGDLDSEAGQSVVLERDGTRILGVMMVENLDEGLKEIEDDEDEALVAVYLPLSYQLGGYTVFVPKSSIRVIDWSVSKTMQVCLSGGILKQKKEKRK